MNLKQDILLSFAILGIFALFLFIIFGDHGIGDLNALKAQKASLVNENAALVRKNIRLLRMIDRLNNDLGFIESVARHDLGMIGKDELIFKVNKKGNKSK